MPTLPSRSSTRVRAAAPEMPRWIFSTSAICRSIVCSGLSEVIGSWKMMVMSLPRTWRMPSCVSFKRSRPLKVIEPVGWLADG